MRRLVRASIYLSLIISPAALAFDKPPFPRLGGVNNGAPQNYDDPAYQAKLARLNMSILAVWPGWNSGRAMTMEKVVENIKAINPRSMVFLYVSNNELSTTDTSRSELIAKVNAMKWWLYRSGTSGTPVPSAYGSFTEVNNTVFTAPDSNGDRWVDWYAKWSARNYYVPNPSIDGFFTDNVFWRPRVNGDWNLDGKLDAASEPTSGVWYRQGYQRHFNVLNQAMPGKFQIGNVADWGSPKATLTYLSGVLNGGVIEGMIGVDYSPEKFAGWQGMMNWYRKTMDAMAEPKLVIFNQQGNPTDYQAFRYGFASCLMDDGYYSFTDLAVPYSGVVLFDEYNFHLGNSLSSPPTTAWQKGVYRRDFQNGIALVNPKGNGPQTVQLETDFQRLSGKQDATTNSGQTTKTVTLKDRDGIILMRMNAVSQPQPPVPTIVR